MQVVIVGLGAWLIIKGKIGPGVLFANMILGSRALAPIERVVGSWSSLVAGLQAYDRLGSLLQTYEAPQPVTKLPRPSGLLSVEGVSFSPRGSSTLLLNGVSFQLPAGETLGIVGHSGAGKSTLTRLLVGVWKPNSGVVRLDGADVFQWDRESFGEYVGYLPQDAAQRSQRIRELESLALKTGQTQLFIETPYRNDSMLESLLQTLSAQTRLAVACGLGLESERIESHLVEVWRARSIQPKLKDPCIFLLVI
jgi:ABC-type bacteriocin/lantibiotic exporter with double-glycine peptidase domain